MNLWMILYCFPVVGLRLPPGSLGNLVKRPKSAPHLRGSEVTAGREDTRAQSSSDLILTTSCSDRWGEKFSEFYKLGDELRVEGPIFKARLKSQSPLVAKPLSPGRDPVHGGF